MKRKNVIRAIVISDIGRVRSNHEDNFLLHDGRYIQPEQQRRISQTGMDRMICEYHSEIPIDNAIFAVSDGMGGHNSGEIASYLAISQLHEMQMDIIEQTTIERMIEQYQRYIDTVNKKIAHQAENGQKHQGMGATLATLIIGNGQIVGMNIGDCRIYKYDGNQLSRLTKDHTEGQRLIDLKIISPEEQEAIPTKKSLSRYLGMTDQSVRVKSEPTEIQHPQEREWYIITSDGLTDNLSDDGIELIINYNFDTKDIRSAAEKLVERAKRDFIGYKGGNDNITTMIIEILPS